MAKNLIHGTVLAVGLLIGANSFANPVVMRVGLDSTGGQIGALQAFLSRANKVAAQVNPNGTGRPLLIENTFHGANSPGGASVAVTFDSLEDWAEVTANQRSSAEWTAVMQTFPANGYRVSFQGLSEIVWQTQGATAPTPGNVLIVYNFEILQGGIQPMVAFLERVTGVGRSENIGGQPTLMVPIMAGSETAQAATVVVRFDSATAWAQATARQNASSAWQAAFSSFPVQNYRLTYQGMSTVMPIPD
ncbi:MAG: hypothetical protein R3F41_14270 [Gammaproteobacteria bacterium]|nr:hypothetical protein [Pseudomonadales bacterium]MCP5347144.1 hypothetical protein [Pseudomonadales bacterium]